MATCKKLFTMAVATTVFRSCWSDVNSMLFRCWSDATSVSCGRILDVKTVFGFCRSHASSTVMHGCWPDVKTVLRCRWSDAMMPLSLLVVNTDESFNWSAFTFSRRLRAIRPLAKLWRTTAAHFFARVWRASTVCSLRKTCMANYICHKTSKPVMSPTTDTRSTPTIDTVTWHYSIELIDWLLYGTSAQKGY